jgi:hypothetical protein
MHFHPILLVRADSLREAKHKAEAFCDMEAGEHSYFDGAGIIADEQTLFNKPLAEVRNRLPPDTSLHKASEYLAEAEQQLQNKLYGSAGHYYRRAGGLMTQCFSEDAAVFNIEYYDYSRGYDEGWFAIEADFRG